jgi:hypothetical protein
MPINQLIKEGKLDRDTGAVLNCAYEHVLRELGLVNREDALTNIVAEKVIEVGATARSDPTEIAKAAIKILGGPNADIHEKT